MSVHKICLIRETHINYVFKCKLLVSLYVGTTETFIIYNWGLYLYINTKSYIYM